jgi:hypothetical protein
MYFAGLEISLATIDVILFDFTKPKYAKIPSLMQANMANTANSGMWLLHGQHVRPLC